MPSNAELQTITTDEQVTTDDDAADSLVGVAVAGSLPVRLLQQLVTAAAATAAYSPLHCTFPYESADERISKIAS